tara:strand:- start:5144 stop:6184 length:1041 start_codon:yes stop_codon:yes gene_type:complete
MQNYINKQDSFFVAGHNGMVGQAIIKTLKKSGYCNEKLGGKLIFAGRNELDLTSYEKVMSWFKINKPNVVIIAAAKVGGIYANKKNPYNFISENIKISFNLIEAAWKYGSKRLLFLGSSCIYPKDSNLPIKEEQLLSSYLEETNEAYAIAKITGIKLCEAIRKQYNFDAISLMPTNLYGPGDNYSNEESHVMASLIKKFIIAKRNNFSEVICWGTGNPLREFLHVDDLGFACLKALERWNPDDRDAPKNDNKEKLFYLNVGSGKEISIKDLAIKIAQLTKYEGNIIWDKSKPDGTFRKIMDSTRIKSIGWEPKINLNNGIKQEIHEIEKALNDKSDKGRSIKNFLN